MSKTLSELFNMEEESSNSSTPTEEEMNHINTDIILNDAKKISDSLPYIHDLGNDTEFDDIAKKALQTYEDLMDLGMAVEGRYSGRILEVASQMLKISLESKSAKYDKKLEIIKLQLKNRQLDMKEKDKPFSSKNSDNPSEGMVIDRNTLIKQIKSGDTE